MSVAKYKQIAKTIEARIDNGEYPKGFKLPTHRVLADELNTTPATVAKAYQLLVDKKRVESFVGRGTFVCSPSRLSDVIQPADDETDFNFSILQPCLSQNLSPLRDAMMNAAEQLSCHLMGYTEHSGHESHRLAAVTWAKKFGLEGGNVKNTLLTNGAQHGLSLLIHTLTEPGDTIAVEALTYPGIMAIAQAAGRHVVGVKLDEQGMCPDDLQQVITQHQPKLVIVVPSHQNPTGITMPPIRRDAIATVIERNNIWLIEDDIYGFLNPDPIAAISNRIPLHSFHISGLSKALSPALRCGFLKVPESHIAVLQATIRANIWLSSPLNYIAATQLIESGEAFELAENQRETACKRQQLARDILSHDGNETGFQIWWPLPQHWQQERFVMEAKNQGLIVSSGRYFNANGDDPKHIRLSLMAINSEQRLQQGLTLLRDLAHSEVSSVIPF
ncbi:MULTISPECIES: PLP-dependent aminotransferase family protein [unclassified Photobacterium]|uniref:aminotransferase-like domain-containing protein n=1 Tax=unclassified Photobacterium TaxID=2628852 RepID=UPI000D172938|nr:MULTISPECIES: PLP-dependent aminotransferase family protein [unclassified Photobacterium]PSV28566.1 PLP-dependent aminotransferase family protein [Photobacterium sp. GB-72]PSV34610.1 PLP-dependent aminotransferase family protein [Photobacterium sp. GB-210]PSW73252.1 PLP-dependent aminotransferase family protein [Photobacterium sp. GB-50]